MRPYTQVRRNLLKLEPMTRPAIPARLLAFLAEVENGTRVNGQGFDLEGGEILARAFDRVGHNTAAMVSHLLAIPDRNLTGGSLL